MLNKCLSMAIGLVMTLPLLGVATAQDEKQPNVELGLKVKNARLVDADKPGAPFGNMTAEVTVKNNGSEIVGVSAFEFKFFLFDAKDASVYLMTWDEPPGPDASPLQPGESKTFRIKCHVTYENPSTEKPYRLVTVGYGTAALSTFKFRPKDEE